MFGKRCFLRAGPRKLLLERLEDRRVLDGQLGDLSEEFAPADSAETGSAEPAAETAADVALPTTFDSAEQLQAFLAEDAEQRWGDLFGTTTRHYPWLYSVNTPLAEVTFATQMSVRNDVDYSQTNVQVAGVDEGDIIETDGRYLYLNSEQEIVIVDTVAETGLRVVSRVDVTGRPLAMYLAGDRLSVIAHAYGSFLAPGPLRNDAVWGSPWQTESHIFLSVIDVSSPQTPQLISEVHVDGNYVDSRMIDDVLYLVSRDAFHLPPPEKICTEASDTVIPETPPVDPPTAGLDLIPVVQLIDPWPRGRQCTYETREQYWDRLGDDWLDEALPGYAVRDPEGGTIATGLLNDPQNTYRPRTEDEHRLVSISAIDVSTEVPVLETSTGVPLNWTSSLYVSRQNLYAVTENHESGAAAMTTDIYQFSLDRGAGSIELAGVGNVPGRVLNQFSLDEYDGFLRIVTQEGWNETASSNLYVLELSGETLEIVGRLEDLAPGERLYSVRFIEDRAFVVTFGPIDGAWYDPLFTIDLSDPSDPQVQGELEIPGFSNYLQLIDQQYLVGLGRNADETNGRSLEPQISLFDVSNFEAPELSDRLSFGDADRSWSEAFNEHLAISYFAESGVLAIPMNTWSEPTIRWEDDFVGTALLWPARQPQYALFVFQIDVSGESGVIRHLGTIEHTSPIRRSLRIEDRLYSLSRDTIRAHEILNPTVELDSLDLRLPTDEQRMVALARNDLAERLGCQASDVDLVSVRAVEWPDGCLGLGGPDELCTLALVPGFEVTLAYEGTEYAYRTDMAEQVALVEQQSLESLVRIRLEAVDQTGAPLDQVEAGEAFTVNVYVDDLRVDGKGVFASYVDILYSSRLMEVDGDIAYDAEYRNGHSGSLVPPGLIDEVGAFAHFDELGEDERLLLSIPFQARRGGTASLVMTPADGIGHEVLIYGSNEIVRWDQVELVGTEIEILGTWQNVEQPTDVNDDGATTALDALHCVNALNSEGSRPLQQAEQAAGMADGWPAYIDVNGDRDLSPEDALIVVNELNSGRRRTGDPAPIRPVAAWVDWKLLAAGFDQEPWRPLRGVGMGRHEMLDLSHEILAGLDADNLQSQVPDNSGPGGAAQVQAVLAAEHPPLPADTSVDRLIEAAEDLESSFDGLDLEGVLAGVAPDFDGPAARQIYRDRFFTRISNTDFLGKML